MTVPRSRPGTVPGTMSELAASDSGEAAAVRRAIAELGVVLLGNDGTLPLAPRTGRIVLVGPAADELRIHFWAYTSVASAEVPLGAAAMMAGEVPGLDPEAVFSDIFQLRMPGIEERFEAEARRIHPDAPTVLEALRRLEPTIGHVPLGRFDAASGPVLSQASVERAVAGADIVIAVVGERTGWVGYNTAGEGQTSVSPSLPGDQDDLVTLLAAVEKPLVTVVVTGRPLLLDTIARASNPVILAPLLGEEAGPVIADALFGVINPSGKLPSMFPRQLGQLPIYHGHHVGSGYGHPTGARHGYLDLEDGSPLYPFGHGLSHSSFDVAFDPAAASAVKKVDGCIRAPLIVSNPSALAGEVVVQLYARDEAAEVRPIRQLLAFSRLALAAGDTATVVLEALVERLFYTMPDGSRGVEAGEVTVMAGLSSVDIRCTETIMLTLGPS
nr:glycoside hydrolase family 3 C-terminal domain-containing protein [Frankia nepalensis]